MFRPLLAASVLAALTLPPAAHAAGTRTHVSNAGSDANTSFSCDYAHPCRTFAAALTQTTPGGEILAIDSSGYGKLVIDRSVSIIAAPGVFAGIGVGASGNATGIEIATAGVNVVLRGLTITGQGGAYGINMTGGASLSVENCVVSNFSAPSAVGIRITAPASVRVADTLVRDNYAGTVVMGSATANISGSEYFGNTQVGIEVFGTPGPKASISDTVVAGNGGGWGIGAEASPGMAVKLRAARIVVTNHDNGITAWSGGGTAAVWLSDSVVSGNTTGLLQSGAGATFHSLGNNAVVDNGTNATGTITSAAPM